jgi:hypothetical protein
MPDINAEIVAKATAELDLEIEKELAIPTPSSQDEIAEAISSNVIRAEGRV